MLHINLMRLEWEARKPVADVPKRSLSVDWAVCDSRGRWRRVIRKTLPGALVLASVLAATVWAEPAPKSVSLREWFGSADFDAIRLPDRVESLPVESLANSSKDWKSGMKTTLPGSFRILPEPLPVDRDIAAELARQLLRPESYDPGYSGCIFEPGITFRFWKDGRALDVFLCFHCVDLGFQVVGADEALGGKLSFGPIRSRLAQLVRKARPDDSRFSQLK